jgi:transcriptional regulator with XRE-family HTH domain
MGNKQEAGEKLKEAREAKDITLEEAQAKTKVHIGILRNLEKGIIPENMNEVYLRGLIRIYANFLRLDSAAIVEEFDVGTPMTDEGAATSKEEPAQKQRDFTFPAAQVASVIKLALIIIAVWLVIALFLSGVKKVARAITSKRRPVKVVEAVKAVPPPENIPVVAEKPTNISLSIHAKKNSWLHVKADGKTIFQGIFRRGASETWTAKEKLDLSLGDAGAVELAINDKRIPPLGRRGEAIRNVKITKEGISVGESR